MPMNVRTPRVADQRLERALLAAAVLALHVLIVLGLVRMVVHARKQAPPSRVQVRFIAAPARAAEPRPTSTVATTATPPAAPVVARRAADSRPVASHPSEAAPAAPAAAIVSAEAASSPASAAADDSLLDGEATRRAIRLTVQQGSLATRANDQVAVRSLTPGQSLPGNMQRAGKGDCMKGEYGGAGMGLLSIPFLAAAVATGNCAK